MTNPLAKRVYDFTLAAIGLMVTSPVWLVLALLVKCSDGGPVFYREQRVGLGGRLFWIWKFRTMVVNADQQGLGLTKDGDARIRDSSKMKIATLNVHSLVTKIDRVRQFVNNHNIDILCIQESWLNRFIANSIVSIPGYTITRLDRPNQSGYGGVLIYVRQGFVSNQMDIGDPSLCESIWIKISINSGYVVLGNVYRPPKSNINLFLGSLENILATLRNYVVVGDFNILGKQAKYLNNFLSRNGLRQLVAEPTYIKPGYTSMLDLFITNLPRTVTCQALTSDDVGSDHLPVIGVFDLTVSTRKRQNETIVVRSKYTKTDSFRASVAHMCRRHGVTNDLSADELWAGFSTEFSKAYDQNFPLKNIRLTHEAKVALTPSLISSIKMGRRLYRVAYITQSNIMWQRYYNHKKEVDRLIKTHRSSVFRQRLNSAPNVAAKWRVLNTALQSGRERHMQSSTLSAEAHAFAFKSMVEAVKNSVANVRCENFEEYMHPEDNCCFTWHNVACTEVHKAIGKLKNGASNYEGVAAEAIKDCADSVAPVLAALINKSFEEGRYPSCFKMSKITPIYKEGDRDEPANYRPISIIPVFSKIFETVVHAQVAGYFAEHSLYSSTQYGFIAGRSTVSACADAADYIHKMVDEQYTVGMVLLDLSKAFDIISHQILLKKLAYYGFGRNVIKWFESYLDSRVGYVNNSLLASVTVPGIGVPQGSVLGPLLFNIYVNDLCNSIGKGTLIQYADDTTIIIESCKSPVVFVDKVERAVSEVIQWFRANRLQVNFKKCNFIVFGRNRHLIHTINIDGHTIKAGDSVKLLGLRIDSNLCYTSHINYVISRVKQITIMLIRLAHLFSRSIRQDIVKALVLPVINLYDFIYASASTSYLHRLDIAYNDLMRVILGIRRSVHFRVADLHKATSLDRLSDRRQKSLCKFMQEVVEERIHSRLRQYCLKRSYSYSMRSCSYVIPRFSTNIGRQRIVVRGLKLLSQQSDLS